MTMASDTAALHASDYDFNDDLLPIGARFWVELVRDRLGVDKSGRP